MKEWMCLGISVGVLLWFSDSIHNEIKIHKMTFRLAITKPSVRPKYDWLKRKLIFLTLSFGILLAMFVLSNFLSTLVGGSVHLVC